MEPRIGRAGCRSAHHLDSLQGYAPSVGSTREAKHTVPSLSTSSAGVDGEHVQPVVLLVVEPAAHLWVPRNAFFGDPVRSRPRLERSRRR